MGVFSDLYERLEEIELRERVRMARRMDQFKPDANGMVKWPAEKLVASELLSKALKEKE